MIWIINTVATKYVQCFLHYRISNTPRHIYKKKNWWIVNNLKISALPTYPPLPWQWVCGSKGKNFSQVSSSLVESPLPLPPPKLLNFGLPFRKITTSLDVFSSSLFIKLPFHRLIFNQSPMILSSTQSSCKHMLTLAVKITEKSNNRITDSRSLLNPFTPKISSAILLTVSDTVLILLEWRIQYWISCQSLDWYFSLFSSAWNFIDIVRRNFVMVVKLIVTSDVPNNALLTVRNVYEKLKNILQVIHPPGAWDR